MTLDQLLLQHAMAGHPLPYSIEQDWTWEVLDADRRIVIKCSSYELAREFVKSAEKRDREDRAIEATFSPEWRELLNILSVYRCRSATDEPSDIDRNTEETP